jgi:endonuclease/exonuclease/phosphatase family metal-dependent hydrolase
MPVLFFGFIFLFFFQLSADFIEAIYTFGLLGTNIPPEIISVVLFFTPLILLIFPRRLPHNVILALAAGAGLARALAVSLPPAGKMLASGVGTGCLLVLLPAILAHLQQADEDAAAQEMGLGLALALGASVLLRARGAGSDFSLLHPWLSWLLALGMLAVLPFLARGGGFNVKTMPRRIGGLAASFGSTAALSIGLMSALLMLYFSFTSPVVLSRWTEMDYRLILLGLAVATGVYLAALLNQRLTFLSRAVLLTWNALFVGMGVLAILLSQVSFPAAGAAFPIDQPSASLWRHIPLWVMIVLSPVILLDAMLLVRELAARKPSPRALAGGFSLASLVFLLFVFAQVFTTVYDYIPVVGPWFRDRFWLVFLLAGLAMALPLLLWRGKFPREFPAVLRAWVLPLAVTPLLAAVLWAAATAPKPALPAQPAGLRVLTYNLQQGYSADGQRSYQEQLELVRELSPDVIGLQESDTARFAGGNADLVRTFTEGLGMYSYYGPRSVTGTFGIALLSRYPIRNPQTFFMYSLGEQTAAILAQIEANGATYNILVTHLGNSGPIIQQQQVLQRLQGLTHVIAMGDFNFDLASPQYALTRQTLDDAWELAGSPTTQGLNIDHLIDHIFVSPGTAVLSAQYIVSPLSDHPGLLVEIQP